MTKFTVLWYDAVNMIHYRQSEREDKITEYDRGMIGRILEIDPRAIVIEMAPVDVPVPEKYEVTVDLKMAVIPAAEWMKHV